METANWARRTAIGIILVVVWIVWVEAASFGRLRAANGDTDVIPRARLQAVYRSAPWVASLADEWRPSNVFDYRAYVGWERRPFRGQTINIDETGVRRTVPSDCADEKAYTIWMFGGSTMWGAGVPDWLTIPSLLAKQFEANGRKVCVRNFGEKAWVNTQEMIKLVLEIKQAAHHPDLVVFYDGPADVYETYQSGQAGLHQNFADIRQTLERRSSSGGFGYLRETNTAKLFSQQRSAAGISRRTSNSDPQALARETVKCYLENVRVIQGLATSYNFHTAFFWEPTLSTGNKPLTTEEKLAASSASKQSPGLAELNRITYSILQHQAQPPIFPIADALDSASDTIYFDEAHVSAEGNRLIAARMYADIQTGLQ